jgi:diguanylate cyclase (GGDEF)-like protein
VSRVAPEPIRTESNPSRARAIGQAVNHLFSAVDAWALVRIVDDPLRIQRGQWIVRVSLTVGIFAAFLAPFLFLSYPDPTIALINCGYAAMLFMCPWLLRKTGSGEFATHWLLASGFAILTYETCLLGGIESPTFTWFILLPFVGALLGGRRCAAVWGYATGLSVVTLVALQSYGVIGDGAVSPSMIFNRGMSVSLLTFLIAHFGWFQVREATNLVRRLEEERSHFRQAATRDPLTGLLNRSLLSDRLAQVIARTARRHTIAALYYADLDGFKDVNDRHGHSIGDLLLQEVSARLSSQTRACDSVLRVGGDEFVLIVEDLADRKAASRLAEKFVQLTAEPFVIDGTTIDVGLSVGIALIERGDKTPDELLDAADAAMYAAKRDGTDCCFA